jgi:hypothetical protein
VTAGTDCNDSSASIYVGASETVADGVDQDCDLVDSCYQDADNDNYGTSTIVDGSSLNCTTGTGAPVTGDCLDTNAYAFPGAAELESSTSCREDADADGYGDSLPPTGVTAGGDCNDSAYAIHPYATETVGDSIDYNCDGAETCYDDDDNDGYLDSTGDTRLSTDTDCADAYEGTATDPTTDCDDSDAGQYPGAPEYCNGEDDDCDTFVDEDDAVDVLTWYADADSDTYGDPLSSDFACDQPTGYVADATDCDDTLATVHPGAAEYCNSDDDDCDGFTDEYGAVDGTPYYADDDLDGYGDPTSVLTSCGGAPTGYTADNTDCDDTDDLTYPGALEICGDGHGNDCNETVISDACPAVGALVITEIMVNPALTTDPAGEWFEITNVSSSTYDLEGLVIADLAGSDQIDVSLVLGPGEYALFAYYSTPLRWYDFAYTGITLNNSGNESVTIRTAAESTPASTTIDTVAFNSSWPFGNGVAMAFSPTPGSTSAVDNGTSTNWAAATCSYHMNLSVSPYYEKGTPGGENDLVCPVIEALDPSEIALSTTPTITLTGTNIDSGFDTPVVVVGTWGSSAELPVSVLTSTELEFDAPSESADVWRDVILYNGINLAFLDNGLGYTSISAAYIWWPLDGYHYLGGYSGIYAIPADSSTTATFYGRLDKTGLSHYCDGTAPTSITAQFGVGDYGTDPRYDASWTWTAATFNTAASCSSPQNEYMYTVGPFTSGDIGTYAHTFRYSYYSGPWVYGEYRDDIVPADSGYTVGEVLDLTEIGTFEVTAP